MIDLILKGLKDKVGGEIIEKVGLPSNKLDSVMEVIGESTKEEVGNQLQSGGGISTLMNLFSNNTNSGGANQLQSNIQNGIVSSLIQKLGLSSGIANSISNIAVPTIINLITNKNNETSDDDSSPLGQIFGNLGGSSGIGGALGGLFK